MAGAVVHFGHRSAEQVGYDLAWQARAARADDWRPDEAVLPPGLADALAAEHRRAGWAGYDEVPEVAG